MSRINHEVLEKLFINHVSAPWGSRHGKNINNENEVKCERDGLDAFYWKKVKCRKFSREKGIDEGELIKLNLIMFNWRKKLIKLFNEKFKKFKTQKNIYD